MSAEPDRFTGDSFTFSADRDGSAGNWDAYQALYARGGEVFRERPDYHAQVSATRLDRVILFERRLRGLRHERRPEHLTRTGFDHFTLHLNLGGEVAVDTGDGFRPLAAGAAIVLDARLPMRLNLIDVHLITASLARGLVEAAGPVAHGKIIAPERTAALRRRLEMGAADTSRRAAPTVELLMLSMLSPDRAGTGRLRRRAIQRAIIRDFVETNLPHRQLGPSVIARACAISRATLYRLTEPDGGVSSFVRKVRLARLEFLLAHGDDGSMDDLAERLGFADSSHMSRQFRAVTGISPGRYRVSSQDDDAGAAARRRWAAWMAEFR